jgi:hypothetical protein
MVMIPGPKAASKSKVRRRNLLIEWMVLLIQNTRADPWIRKTSEQEEIAPDSIFLLPRSAAPRTIVTHRDEMNGHGGGCAANWGRAAPGAFFRSQHGGEGAAAP